MTAITNYDAYVQTLKEHPRRVSNDYLTPAETRVLIERGKLRYATDGQSLFLFERREGFTKLRFRLASPSAKLPVYEGADGIEPAEVGNNREDNDIIAAYLVYRAGSPPTLAADWLLSQGFNHTMTLERYTTQKIAGIVENVRVSGELREISRRLVGISDAFPSISDEIGGDGGKIRSSGVVEVGAEETYAMLSAYFAAPEMDMPCRDMFGRALGVRSGDGNLLGILYIGQTRIVAVSPDARGMGIGGKLYRAFAAQELRLSKNPVFHEWIRPENSSSIAMFSKLGFIKSDAIAQLYSRSKK
ncbi:MAG: GNAT family N-acetyltransferase [Oscillospiraceae bacterium]|nr:GNAT family N-acetyltransferase [Oscillospiraceae bacterium]